MLEPSIGATEHAVARGTRDVPEHAGMTNEHQNKDLEQAETPRCNYRSECDGESRDEEEDGDENEGEGSTKLANAGMTNENQEQQIQDTHAQDVGH